MPFCLRSVGSAAISALRSLCTKPLSPTLWPRASLLLCHLQAEHGAGWEWGSGSENPGVNEERKKCPPDVLEGYHSWRWEGGAPTITERHLFGPPRRDTYSGCGFITPSLILLPAQPSVCSQNTSSTAKVFCIILIQGSY